MNVVVFVVPTKIVCTLLLPPCGFMMHLLSPNNACIFVMFWFSPGGAMMQIPDHAMYTPILFHGQSLFAW